MKVAKRRRLFYTEDCNNGLFVRSNNFTKKRKESSMNDFITLECPSCGGNLSISPYTYSLKCEYCGREHFIRREAGNILLEGFIRCPNCHNNYRSKKISAMNRWQEPPKPIEPKLLKEKYPGFGYWWIVLWIPAGLTTFGLTAIFGLPFFVNPNSSSGLGYLLFGELISIVINIIFWVQIDKRKAAKNKTNAENQYTNDKKRYEIDKPKWDLAISKWKRIYYCELDDIIFDPETGRKCDPYEINEFVYS
jgi:hypothetical protein